MWPHLWPGGTFWSGFDAIWPNIVASALIAVVVWFWKIRPHFRHQRERQQRTHRLLENLHHQRGVPFPEGDT